MDYILNIHTATEKAIVNICRGESVLNTLINDDPKQHATFLHGAIHKLLQNSDISINQLKAIGVTNGPGSYTGIRVGLATAKGLCYSLKIPLITYNVLEVMALSAKEEIKDQNAFYCPMIDARRMEVFTAVYDYSLNEVLPPSAKVIDEFSYAEILSQKPVYFFGNGSIKLKNILQNKESAHFTSHEISSESLCKMAIINYRKNIFDNVAYAQPLYLKEFYSTQKIQ